MTEQKRDPWRIVELSRDKRRLTSRDYIENVFSSFYELHGDRLYGDDPAHITCVILFEDDNVLCFRIFVEPVEHQEVTGVDPGIHVRVRHGRNTYDVREQYIDYDDEDQNLHGEPLEIVHSPAGPFLLFTGL